MTVEQFFRTLTSASAVAEIVKAIADFEKERPGETSWVPVGRENNRGAIEASADPGRALIERLTNGIDAVLEAEHDAHHGKPDCRSPREAAMAWLGVPAGGISAMGQKDRQTLAQRVTILLLEGEDRAHRLVEVRDTGIGIKPEEMSKTILSLGNSNKMGKYYVAGTFGQGGSATFAVAAYTVIASRFDADPSIGFTVVRYLDLPAELYKTGHYVYLALKGAVPSVQVPVAEFPAGTVARHYGYDLSGYSLSFGPTSVYGLLQRALFDPVMPVWLDSRVHNYRRTIKGARNALAGAVDEGDESKTGPDLDHSMPMFYVNLPDYGSIGIEYWVLQAAPKNKTPNAAFVEPNKPIVLTMNGQNHAEMSGIIIRKHAELPYLRYRLICHVDCNSLTATAKRALFVSNREEARRGQLYDLIESEIVKALKSDDDLERLNEEAKAKGQKEEDATAAQQMRSEVARLLRLQGMPIAEGAAATPGGTGTGTDTPTKPRPHKPSAPRPPITPQEPPTYIKLVWDATAPITFHAEQRRYIRVETDANSSYHNPQKPESSRINVILEGGDVTLAGTTPLTGGRMRIILGAKKDSSIGNKGKVRVELSRPGQATLSDDRAIEIVAPPKVKTSSQQLTLPPFRVEPVSPSEERWTQLAWPDDVNTIASDSEPDAGTLVVYFSTAFPPYANHQAKLEKQDTVLAASFTERYKIWLAVHALMKEQHQKEATERAGAGEQQDVFESDLAEQRDREERVRVATLAAMFAAREVRDLAAAAGEAMGA
jgi:hypothetical protein